MDPFNYRGRPSFDHVVGEACGTWGCASFMVVDSCLEVEERGWGTESLLEVLLEGGVPQWVCEGLPEGRNEMLWDVFGRS